MANDIVEKDAPIKLNVILVAYNHEEYIEQSLRSIMMQKTDFKFNVIVADDCSTDRTLEIIKGCEPESPHEFVFMENKENLGLRQNFLSAFDECEAEYVALMEGDDYWTSPDRLQKHIDFLDSHLECHMSFNAAIVIGFDEDKFAVSCFSTSELYAKDAYGYMNTDDAITSKFGGPGYSTCVFRRTTLARIWSEDFFKLDDGRNSLSDWATLILSCARFGYAAFHHQNLTVHRQLKTAVWSGMDTIAQFNKILELCDMLDEYTGFHFEDAFSARKNPIELYFENERCLRDATGKDETNKDEINEDEPRRWSFGRLIRSALMFVPPLFIWIAKALVPRIVTRYIPPPQ